MPKSRVSGFHSFLMAVLAAAALIALLPAQSADALPVKEDLELVLLNDVSGSAATAAPVKVDLELVLLNDVSGSAATAAPVKVDLELVLLNDVS